MKYFRIAILVVLFPLITGSTTHKYFVSITKIEYVAVSEDLQIITQIFIDDIEESTISENLEPSEKLSKVEIADYFIKELKKIKDQI